LRAIRSIQFLDIIEESVIDNAFYVGIASKGAITYNDLRSMELNVYRHTLHKANEIIKQLLKNIGM
jgi:hypothetical protein